MTSAVHPYVRPETDCCSHFFSILLSLLLSLCRYNIYSVHRGECHMPYYTTLGIGNIRLFDSIRFLYIYIWHAHTARTSCHWALCTLYIYIYIGTHICAYIMRIVNHKNILKYIKRIKIV